MTSTEAASKMNAAAVAMRSADATARLTGAASDQIAASEAIASYKAAADQWAAIYWGEAAKARAAEFLTAA